MQTAESKSDSFYRILNDNPSVHEINQALIRVANGEIEITANQFKALQVLLNELRKDSAIEFKRKVYEDKQSYYAKKYPDLFDSLDDGELDGPVFSTI